MITKEQELELIKHVELKLQVARTTAVMLICAIQHAAVCPEFAQDYGTFGAKIASDFLERGC